MTSNPVNETSKPSKWALTPLLGGLGRRSWRPQYPILKASIPVLGGLDPLSWWHQTPILMPSKPSLGHISDCFKDFQPNKKTQKISFTNFDIICTCGSGKFVEGLAGTVGTQTPGGKAHKNALEVTD